MQPAGQIAEKLLATMAPTTKDSNTASTALSMTPAKNLFPEFRTQGDPVLEQMAEDAAKFVHELQAVRVEKRNPYDFGRLSGAPRWLSFCGPSGTGKTLLATMVFEAARKMQALWHHKELITPILNVFWPDALEELRSGNYALGRDLADCNFLLLDEIAIEHDPSGFARDKLCEMLSRRISRWTVLTSNLTLASLGAIDQRISSRMVRGKSVVVACNTIDWALRK